MKPADEIKQQTIAGVKWNLVEQTGVYLVTLCSIVVLSRILLPEDFGLFGMIVVLANFASLVVGMGLGYSVIQNRSLSQADLSSIFWFNVSMGILVGVVFFVCAPWIAEFYHQPDLILITRCFSVVFIFQGANSVPLGLLIKQIGFKKLAKAQISSAVASYLIAIVFAIREAGAWSLLVQALTFQFGIVFLNFSFSRWRPALTFSWDSLKKVRNFSLNFLFSQVVEFAAVNIDSVLTGKYLGKRDLGYLGRSTALAMLPVTSFGYVLNRTFFPWFSALQDDTPGLRFRYLQAVKILIMLIIPVLVIIGITSADVVLLLFGQQWTYISPYVTILSIYASFCCVNHFNDSFTTSQGRTDLLLKINLVEKTILVVGVIVGLRYGLTGIVAAKALVTAVLFFPRIVLISRLIDIRPSLWFRSLRIIFVALVLMAAVATVLNMLLVNLLFFERLITVALFSMGFYLFLLLVMKEKAVDEVKNILIDQYKSMSVRKKPA